ncbi:MAG: MFS transporter [Kiloniellales bacterium]
MSLAVLAICQVAAMALWFSATAVVPALRQTYALGGFAEALFTSSVQAGFVAGTLLSAVTGLADRLDPRRFFMASALIGAAANAAILVLDPASPWVAVPRFVTGMCMAGVYPGGMKLATTWAKGDMGLLLGLLVGALTLGSAAPHLFNALGGVDWRFTVAAASASAAGAALLINLAGLGPNLQEMPRFNTRMVLRAWQVKPLRLANLGYFGHMWELYAMWAWITLFLHASFAATMAPESAPVAAKLATFATVGVGALGCLAGGLAADRIGRTGLTMLAMTVSGGCALAIGFLFGADPWLVTALCLIWGVAVVADSPQFSASIAELSDHGLVGTMLTVQTCVGFLLTLVTIHLMPYAVATLGWRYAFAPLAIGPFLGVWAMARLRAHPAAVKLASGNR